ncbi:hypothetical protein [Haliea atlantica]
MDDQSNFPDLQHWKPVAEFTVEQAALLMAGIDPWEIETTEAAKEQSHPRWKKAATHSLAIVAAIRQGLIIPVICRGWYGDYDHGPQLRTIKHSDREWEISPQHTVITRASLESWIANHAVPIFRPPRQRMPVSTENTPKPEPITIDVEPLTLPYQGHRSEGLEFVDEAVEQLWSTFDPDDPATAPTQKEVIEFLRSKGATVNMAEAVNLVLRPRNLVRGGAKKKR